MHPAVTAVASAAAVLLLQKALKRRKYGANKEYKKGIVLLVHGKLAPGQIAKFLECFTPLAEYCALHEPGTLGYELSIREDDPDCFVLYERYESKAYLEDVHWKSEAFKAFQARCAAANFTWLHKEKVIYVETDIGFA